MQDLKQVLLDGFERGQQLSHGVDTAALAEYLQGSSLIFGSVLDGLQRALLATHADPKAVELLQQTIAGAMPAIQEAFGDDPNLVQIVYLLEVAAQDQRAIRSYLDSLHAALSVVMEGLE